MSDLAAAVERLRKDIEDRDVRPLIAADVIAVLDGLAAAQASRDLLVGASRRADAAEASLDSRWEHSDHTAAKYYNRMRAAEKELRDRELHHFEDERARAAAEARADAAEKVAGDLHMKLGAAMRGVGEQMRRADAAEAERDAWKLTAVCAIADAEQQHLHWDAAEAKLARIAGLHHTSKVWETDRSYTLFCAECLNQSPPCATTRILNDEGTKTNGD